MVCWNPAVPPPPAAGGEEGRPVAGVSGDDAGELACVSGDDAGELGGLLPFESGEALPEWLEATGGPGDGDPPGEGVEAEQADTAAEMSIATVAQPMMASRMFAIIPSPSRAPRSRAIGRG